MRFIGVFLVMLILTASSSLTNEQVYGIDVSHHQGEINWSQVATWNSHKISFVYVKATEGATWEDKYYKRNIQGARAQGIPVGSYHYFRTTSSPEDQFQNFISNVKVSEQDLVPLIDLEERTHWDSETYHKNLKKFLQMVEKHFKKKPMLYTVNRFYNENLLFKYTDYEFLIGRYSSNEPILLDGNSWSIWQFTESGNVKGIPQPVDIDITNSMFTISKIKK